MNRIHLYVEYPMDIIQHEENRQEASWIQHAKLL